MRTRDREVDARYQRERRRKAKAARLCQTCAVRHVLVINGKTRSHCAECAERNAKRMRRLREKGPVRTCAPVAWCDECLVVIVDGRHRPGCETTGTSQSYRRNP